MATFRKIGSVALLSGALALSLLVPSGEAQARNGRNAALFGGLAAGAILGGAVAGSGSAYGAPAYGGYPAYSAPAYPAYGAPAYSGYDRPAYYSEDPYDAPVVVRQCYRQRQAIFDDYGDFAGYRRVRVCN